MKFLNTVAQSLIEDCRQKKRVLVIVPNIRAGVFLKHFLTQNAQTTMFAPDIYSSEEFAQKISELEPAENLELIIKLYSIYNKIATSSQSYTQQGLQQEPENPSFADGSASPSNKIPGLGEFFSLATVLLGDFDEIDRYCADADKLFKAIDELAASSELSLKFKNLWKQFGFLYHNLTNSLLREQRGYTGLQYRIMLENITRQKPDYDVVYWAGLYALTRSEKLLFSYFREHYKSGFKVFLDLDEYYITNDIQEAGAIYRSFWRKQLLPEIRHDFAHKPITIHAISAQGNIGIVKCAGSIIENIFANNPKTNPASVAVVFSDESLLIPMLNTVPSMVKEFNVTMGLPLSMTKVYSFITLLFIVFNSLQASTAGIDEADSISIRELLEHSYMSILCNNSKEALTAVKSAAQDYITKNYSYIPLTILKAVPLIYNFYTAQNGMEALKAISEIIIKLLQNTKEQALVFETEILFAAWDLIDKTLSALQENAIPCTVRELHEMLDTLLSSKTIAFKGEPLKGMQFMGMLETQCLEFSTVIMLSANEGFLPFLNTSKSFIPEQVRKEFGLPVRTNSDEVTAYHFYRLLSHTDTAYLIFSLASDIAGKSEKSRFIYQLKYEYAHTNKNCKFNELIFTFPVVKQKIKPIAVASNDVIKNILVALPYSASALTCYNECTLKFFYTYIMKLKEFQDVEEDPTAAMTGSIFHNSLKKLFETKGKKSLPKSFTIKELKTLKQDIPEAVKNSILEILPNTNFTGNHYILNTAVQYFLNQYIDNTISAFAPKDTNELDYDTIITTVQAVEAEYSCIIKAGTQYQVKLKGTIDRADKTRGHYLVLDFKTGAAKGLALSGTSPEELFGKLSDPKYKQALQLLIYALLLQHNNFYSEPGLDIQCSIYSFKSGSGYKPLVLTIEKEEIPLTVNLLNSFEVWLNSFLQSIIETNLFVQTQNCKLCKLCPYNKLCMRS